MLSVPIYYEALFVVFLRLERTVGRYWYSSSSSSRSLYTLSTSPVEEDCSRRSLRRLRICVVRVLWNAF